MAFKRRKGKRVKKSSSADPGHVRRGCIWCNTCADVGEADRQHKYGAGTCPRFEHGELWRRQHPSIAIRYSVPPLPNTASRMRVSRSYFSSLYHVKQTALQRLANGVRTNDPDRFSKRHRLLMNRTSAVSVTAMPVSGATATSVVATPAGGGGASKAHVPGNPRKRRTNGRKTGLYVRNDKGELDVDNVNPATCSSTQCKLECCTVLSKMEPDQRAAYIRAVRNSCREAYFQGSHRGEDSFLRSGMEVLVRTEAPAVAFKRKMLNKREDPNYVRRGCTWCNTCPEVPKEERNHRYGSGSCPRFADGELWRRQNPSKVIRYTAPPLTDTLKRLRVSRTFFSTLYSVKQKALQRLAQGVRTNHPDRFSKRTGFRDGKKTRRAVKAVATAAAGGGGGGGGGAAPVRRGRRRGAKARAKTR